jgi:drug/metabolite transporter (DMT)-like permease
MTNLQVFIVAGAGILFLKEKPGKNFYFAIPLAIFGLYLILAPDWQETEANYKLGIFFSLVSATSYAFYILFLRRSTMKLGAESALGNMTMISLISAGILSITISGLGESFAIPEKKDWIFLLIYGLLCHGLGWLCIARGISGIPASLTGLVLLLQPTLAFGWDVLIFDRTFSLAEATGAGLTLSAVYLGSSGMNK